MASSPRLEASSVPYAKDATMVLPPTPASDAVENEDSTPLSNPSRTKSGMYPKKEDRAMESPAGVGKTRLSMARIRSGRT